MNRNPSPVEKLVDDFTHRSPAILLPRNTITPTAIADLLYLMDASKDAVIRNVLFIQDAFDHSETVDMMVLPEGTDKNTLLLALSDYVNGSAEKLPCLECIYPDAGGTPLCFELDPQNENVEGNYPIYLGINDGIMGGEDNLLFVEQSLAYGWTADLPEPSEVAKEIKGGKHFTEALYLDDIVIIEK